MKKSDKLMTLKINSELHSWFKDYAERQNTNMSQIIKAHLESLRRKDMRRQRKAEQETIR
ncbi:MAG: hypothetical protein O7E52_18295 [Candidatus Poribacteria bacterium]|nr:hypothetical protein [Candidatus Poribacteria bacterium]